MFDIYAPFQKLPFSQLSNSDVGTYATLLANPGLMVVFQGYLGEDFREDQATIKDVSPCGTSVKLRA